MNATFQRNRLHHGLSRLNLFWALSRTPHGLLDMTTPAFGALLWLGAFPPAEVVLLGALTTFAGYTSVYALNDVVDARADREKLERCGSGDCEHYLDAVLLRHPIAQGALSFAEGLAWAGAWAVVALLGAYALDPVCAVVFLAGCAFEILYCLLWKVSHLRVLVSGIVKTSGGVAAVFAVDPHPSALYVLLLFSCLFFWEIGGQNVPADWTDMEEDRRLHARTVPLRLGPGRAADVALFSSILALTANFPLFLLAPVAKGFFFASVALAVGLLLLLFPVLRLRRHRDRFQAMALFNKASYYPPALLCVVVVSLCF